MTRPRLYDLFMARGLSNDWTAPMTPPRRDAPTQAECARLPLFFVTNAAVAHDESVDAHGGTVEFSTYPPLARPFDKFWMEWLAPNDDMSGSASIAALVEWAVVGIGVQGYSIRLLGEVDGKVGFLNRAFGMVRDDMTLIGMRVPSATDGPDVNTGTYAIPLFALALLNCKNITTQEGTMPRAFRRHAPEYAGTASVVHRTLIIPGMDQYTRRVGSLSTSERRRRFHIVRGHFATYTEEARLFGKHVGRFYHPPHVRGDLSAGSVEKDYIVGRQP